MNDYTDDELRKIIEGHRYDHTQGERDLARVLLREREAHIERGERLIVAASELIRLADARDKAEAERDQVREMAEEYRDTIVQLSAALARVEALHRREVEYSGAPFCMACQKGWPCVTVAAIAGDDNQ